MNNMSSSELINMIELNKHDVTIRLRSVVLDPISKMNNGGASSIFFSEQGQANDYIYAKAKEIMDFFIEKWRNIYDSEEKQLSSLNERCNRVISYMIPEITNIVEFYKLCATNSHYFEKSEIGQKALSKMLRAVKSAEGVRKSLENIANLSNQESEENNVRKECCLLEIIQDIFDDIVDAEVIYEDEYLCSKYTIGIDKDKFEEHVLLNIRDNITNHAFGTQKFKKKHIWEKKVTIEIKDINENFIVNIFNNGQPFKGDSSKVFDYGYCHGAKQHTGIGMYSAKKTMKELGGDLSFNILNSRYNKISRINEPCSVVHSITLPKK